MYFWAILKVGVVNYFRTLVTINQPKSLFPQENSLRLVLQVAVLVSHKMGVLNTLKTKYVYSLLSDVRKHIVFCRLAVFNILSF
jgi:hypothetical protein